MLDSITLLDRLSYDRLTADQRGLVDTLTEEEIGDRLTAVAAVLELGDTRTFGNCCIVQSRFTVNLCSFFLLIKKVCGRSLVLRRR